MKNNKEMKWEKKGLKIDFLNDNDGKGKGIKMKQTRNIKKHKNDYKFPKMTDIIRINVYNKFVN